MTNYVALMLQICVRKPSVRILATTLDNLSGICCVFLQSLQLTWIWVRGKERSPMRANVDVAPDRTPSLPRFLGLVTDFIPTCLYNWTESWTSILPPWRQKQYVTPKLWYLLTGLQGAATYRTSIWIMKLGWRKQRRELQRMNSIFLTRV
jgi:hypothetical protein